MEKPLILKHGIFIYKRTKQFLGHTYNTFTDNKPKVVILAYHRIVNSPEFDPLNNIITLSTFLRQIDKIAMRYPFVSLTELIKQGNAGQAKAGVKIILTFDDGYRENYEVIFPILRKKGLPATFFLSTDYIETGLLFWDWQLLNLLHKDNSIKSISMDGQIIQKKPFESRLAFAVRILKRMKAFTPKKRQEIIDSLKAKTEPSICYLKERCISWQEAKEMGAKGMEIGSHGISHRSLARMPSGEAVEEIKKSKEIIEQKISRPCHYFAFPFGSKYDYSQELIDCVKGAGYKACLLNIHGYNHLEKDNFCFKRIIMEETTNTAFLLG